MALSILDGNQSATTLSTILSSGQHITAHTVVSLGTQAITDMRGAVSGSVVSISNLPSTQTIAGTVTAGGLWLDAGNNVKSNIVGFDGSDVPDWLRGNPTVVPISGTVTANISAIYAGEAFFSQSDNPMMAVGGLLDGFNEIRPIRIDNNTGGQIVAGTVTANLGSAIPAGTNRIGVVTIGAGTVTLGASTAQIGSVTASISNSLTISSLPAISGTVTANVAGNLNNTIEYYDDGSAEYVVGVHIKDVGNNILGGGNPLAISGTVTANGGDFSAIVGDSMPAKAVAIGFYSGDDAGIAQVNDSNRKMPISGTVTLGASTSQIGSVTASISNSVVTFYPMQGTSVSNTNFTSVTASTTLVSAVAGREVLTVFNEGAGNLHISPGATATTISYQVRLSPGDYWECPAGQLSLAHTAVFATAGTARVTQVS